MSYISPQLQSKFEELPIDLKNELLSRDIRLESLNDLIAALEEIADSDDDSDSR